MAATPYFYRRADGLYRVGDNILSAGNHTMKIDANGAISVFEHNLQFPDRTPLLSGLLPTMILKENGTAYTTLALLMSDVNGFFTPTVSSAVPIQFPANLSTVMVTSVDTAVTNTDVATELLAPNVGTVTIAANTVAEGSTYLIKAEGTLNTTGTPTNTIELKLNAVSLVSKVITLGADLANVGVSINLTVSFRSTGANALARVTGYALFSDGTTTTIAHSISLNSTGAVAVSSLVNEAFSLTYAFSAAAAGNNLTIHNALIVKQ